MVAQIKQEKNDLLHWHVLYVIQIENLSGKQLASVYFNYALGLCLLNFTCHKAKSETVSAWHSVVVKLIWHAYPGNLERNIEGNICDQIDFKLFTIFWKMFNIQ